MSDSVSNKCRNTEQNADQNQADDDTEQTVGEITRDDAWLYSDVCWVVHAVRVNVS